MSHIQSGKGARYLVELAITTIVHEQKGDVSAILNARKAGCCKVYREAVVSFTVDSDPWHGLGKVAEVLWVRECRELNSNCAKEKIGQICLICYLGR